jgi:hypothetical protein
MVAQFGQVVLAQLMTRAEVGHQRRHPSAEQAVEHRAALRIDPVGALQHRGIQVAPALVLGGDHALLEQAVEEGLDGRFLPAGVAGQRGDDLVGAARRLRPQDFHYEGFGFADRRTAHRRSIYTCNRAL